MITLSVTLPDFAALAWQALSRHLPDVQRARMGAYILSTSPAPLFEREKAFLVDLDVPILTPSHIVIGGGRAATTEEAQRAAYDLALAHARRILAALGGTP